MNWTPHLKIIETMCRLTPSLIIFKLCLWSSGTTLVKWMMRNKQTEIFTRMIKRKLPGGGNDSFYDIKFLSCKNWDGREVDFGSDWAIPRNRTHPYSKNGISIWVMLFPFIFLFFFFTFLHMPPNIVVSEVWHRFHSVRTRCFVFGLFWLLSSITGSYVFPAKKHFLSFVFFVFNVCVCVLKTKGLHISFVFTQPRFLLGFFGWNSADQG